jgi:cellulose synthase/poly-beta-1,6-N-acetylglucosamine synthase-like glycosyltransferase
VNGPRTVVAGVTACNEERTIGPLLEALLSARPGGVPIARLVVVSSACTDRTNEIVRAKAATDGRVALIAEPARRGKAAAINAFLAARAAREGVTREGVTIVSSADVLPAPGAVEAIVAAFDDPAVGMAGGRPVPANPGHGLTARMSRLMWDLHHEAALLAPKLGELVAFRSELVEAIDEATPVDEALLEREVLAKGFGLRYVPDAVISNFGAASLREWLAQRRRIAAGHRWLEKKYGYRVSTAPAGLAARLMARAVLPHPGLWLPALALVGVEAAGRVLGRLDQARGRDHAVWKIVASTRRGAGGPA